MKLTTRNIRMIGIALLVAVLLAATGVVYALFASSVGDKFDYDANLTADITLDVENARIDLLKPTDTKKVGATVRNTSDTDVALSYAIELVVTEGLGQTRDIIVYFDGEPLGALRSLLHERKTVVDGAEIIDYVAELSSQLPLFTNESRKHEISFEYHIGSSDTTAKNFALDISAVARTGINFDKYLFVSNASQLVQIARQNRKNAVAYAGKTLYLTQDIALTESVEFVGSALDIDLNGKTLTLNGAADGAAALKFNGTGVYHVYDSSLLRTGRIVCAADGSAHVDAHLIQDGAGGLLLLDPMLLEAGKSASHGAYSHVLLAQELAADLKSRLASGTGGGTTVTPSADFALYPYYLETSDAAVIDVAADGLSLLVKNLDHTRLCTVTVKTNTGTIGEEARFSATVLGSNDALVERFLQANAPYLLNAKNSTAPLDIDSDIFVPQQARESGYVIRWISTDPSILTTDGRRTVPAVDTAAQLIVTVSNGVRSASQTFFFNVVAKSAEKRLKEYLQLYAVTFNAIGQIQDLPTVTDADDDAKRLGVLSIESFVIPALYDQNLQLLQQDTKLNLLRADTNDRFSVNVTAKMTGSKQVDGIESGELPVYVSLTGTVSIIEMAHNSVLEGLGGRTDKTANVTLPTEYDKQVHITYELFRGQRVINSVTYENPSDVFDYVLADPLTGAIANGELTFDPSKFPIENTTVYVEVGYTYFETTTYQVIEIPIAGILHNGAEGIPDVTLYTHLMRMFDGNGDLLLTRDEIDARKDITELRLSRTRIATLDGLQYFPQFTSIALTDNVLTDISALAECYNVAELDLSNDSTTEPTNKISDISPLANMRNLKVLNLSRNVITDISPLANATGLTSLNLSYVTFTSGDALQIIENMSDLAYLDLSRCFEFTNTRLYDYSLLTAYNNYLARHGVAPQFWLTATLAANASIFMPNATQILYAKILNGVQEIYRIGDVIYLPTKLPYFSPTQNKILQYQLVWEASEDTKPIVDIRDGIATVTQPVADKQITLLARIVSGGGNAEESGSAEIIKFFNAVSSAGTGKYYVETASGVLTAAETVVPDKELLNYFFANVNTDRTDTALSFGGIATTQKYCITQSELAAVSSINLSSAPVERLKGLEYCINLESLNLTSRHITDLATLKGLTKLSSIIFKDGSYDFTQTSDWDLKTVMKSLSTISIENVSNINSESTLTALTNLYVQKPSLKILLQSSNAWNPYAEASLKALTLVDDLVYLTVDMLGEANAIALKRDAQFEYLGKTYHAVFSYTTSQVGAGHAAVRNSNFLYLTKRVGTPITDLMRINVSLYYNPSVPDSTAAADLVSKDVSKDLLAVIVPDYTTKVELPTATFLGGLSGATVNLFDHVSDPSVLNALLPYVNASNVVTRTAIEALTELTFDGTSNTQLSGLELFAGSFVLTKLTIKNYHKTEGTQPRFPLASYLNETNFPNLSTLMFDGGTVDLFDFVGLPVKTLTANNCLVVTMDRLVPDATGTDRYESVFSLKTTEGAYYPLPRLLETLDLSSNQIYDFAAIAEINRVFDMKLYNNPASKTSVTDGHVKDALNSLIQNFPDAVYSFEVTESGVFWTGGSLRMEYILELTASKDGVDTLLRPGLERVNVVESGSRIDLPKYLEYISGGNDLLADSENIGWKISAASAMTLEASNNAVNTYMLTLPAGADFAVLYLTVRQAQDMNQPTSQTELIFPIVIRRSTAAPLGWLEGFMKDGAFVDPFFFNSITRALITSKQSLTGVYTDADVQTLTSFSQPNSSIEDIRGIKSFTGLSSLDIGNNSVVDVSELRFLTNLTNLVFNDNKVKTLYYALLESDQYYVDINGAETAKALVTTEAEKQGKQLITQASVLKDLTKIQTLVLHQNNMIDDFMPISTTDDRQNYAINDTAIPYKAREGLIKLANISAFNLPVKDNAFGADYADGLNMNSLAARFPTQYMIPWMETIDKALRAGTITSWPTLTQMVTPTSAVNTATIKVSYYGAKAFATASREVTVTYSAANEGWVQNTPLPVTVSIPPLYGDSTPKSTTVSYTVPNGASNSFTFNSATGVITALNNERGFMTHSFDLVAYFTGNGGYSTYRLLKVNVVNDRLDGSVVKENYVDVDGTKVPAEEVFPDPVFRSAVFNMFMAGAADTVDKTILTKAAIQGKNITTFNFEKRMIRDITGIDFIASALGKACTFNFSHNAIERFPQIRYMPATGFKATLNLNSNKRLHDLSFAPTGNLDTSANQKAFGSSVTEINLTNCIELSGSALKDLNANMFPNLRKLTILNIGISDYSFLTGLPLTFDTYTDKTTNAAGVSGSSPEQLLEKNNAEYLREFFMTRRKSNASSLDSSTVSYYGVSKAKLVADFLYIQKSYDYTQPIYLVSSLSHFNQTFFVNYGLKATDLDAAFLPPAEIAADTVADASVKGLYYYTDPATGVRYTLFRLNQSKTLDSLTLTLRVQQSNGTAVVNTYAEDVILTFGSSTSVGARLLSDVEVQLQPNGAYVALSSVMPDLVLRYYVIAQYVDRYADIAETKQISYDRLRSVVRLEVGAKSNDVTFFHEKINDLDGLQYFTQLTQLTLGNMNTSDFSPVGTLTGLQGLVFRDCTLKDVSFMSHLKNVVSLELWNTTYEHLSFLNDMSIQTLSRPAGANGSARAMRYVKNALAYQQSFYGMIDYFGNDSVLTRDDEKIGAMMLDRLDTSGWVFEQFGGIESYYRIDAAALKDEQGNSTRTLTVPASLDFDGETVALSVHPLHSGFDNVSVAGNTVTFQPISGKSTIAKFVVRAEYRGGVYERYFEAAIS